MRLEITTAEKLLFQGNVQQVTLPGSLGNFTVLEQHAPLISTLTHGNVVYQVGNRINKIPVESGIAEVLDNKVVVCVYS